MRAQVGDRIKFRVLTRDGRESATRVVRKQLSDRYEVRFRGYGDFEVFDREVTEILQTTEHEREDRMLSEPSLADKADAAQELERAWPSRYMREGDVS